MSKKAKQIEGQKWKVYLRSDKDISEEFSGLMQEVGSEVEPTQKMTHTQDIAKQGNSPIL